MNKQIGDSIEIEGRAARVIAAGSGAYSVKFDDDGSIGSFAQPRLTFTGVRFRLSRHRITVRKTDYGELRVNLLGGVEATAYYTDDLDDALHTGIAMANERDAHAMMENG